MKKIIYLTIIVLSLIIFNSCQKQIDCESVNNEQRVESSNNFDLVQKNNMLSFPSVEDYENAINFLAKDEKNNFKEWNKEFNFKNSMAKAVKTKQIIYKNDNLLSQMINNRGELEIQGKIFCLDFDKRTVKVYYSIDNYSSKKADKVYSFDDEILTLEFGTKAEKKELLSNKSKYAPLYNPAYRYDESGGCKYKIAYHKDGIYFTLVAKIKQGGSNYFFRIPIVQYEWANKNRSESGKMKDIGYFIQVQKLKQRPYFSGRRLLSYSIQASFEAKLWGKIKVNDRWSHSS